MSDYSAVPQYLKDLKQWLVFRIEDRDGRKTKIPYNAQSIKNNNFKPPTGKDCAKTNDPKTWTDFATAVEVAEKAAVSGSDSHSLTTIWSE